MFGSADPVASALATPLMQLMAREGGVVPCGKSGAGVGVKVCNKYVQRLVNGADAASLVLAINQIGLAEGLALGASLEIDPLLLHRIFNGSTGESCPRHCVPHPLTPKSPVVVVQGQLASQGG